MIIKILSSLSIITVLTSVANAVTAPQPTTPTTEAAPPTLDKKDVEVIIYSSKSCYYCTAVKKELDGKKIPYTEKLVDNNPALLKELETKTGKKTVPQVMINGRHVGSYLDIVWGDLDDILRKDASAAASK